MAAEKNLDASKNSPRSERAQATQKKQEIGLPKRREVLAALEKAIKKSPT